MFGLFGDDQKLFAHTFKMVSTCKPLVNNIKTTVLPVATIQLKNRTRGFGGQKIV